MGFRWRVPVSWRPRVLVLPLLLAALGGGARPSADAAPVSHTPSPHDLHIVYGDLAVEGSVVAGRLRFFKHDLERALGPLVNADALTLTPGTEADVLVLRYVRGRLEIRAGEELLTPRLLESGQDELDREPMWWIIVEYRAPSPPEALTVRNRLLHELFDDQRNIFKFVRFPEQTQKTYYVTAEEPEQVVRFD